MRKTNVITPFKKLSHVHQQFADPALSVAEVTLNSRDVRLTKLRMRVFELFWCRHDPINALDSLVLVSIVSSV